MSDLKAQIQLLNERIAHLEAAKAEPAATSAAPPAAATPSTPANGLKSDLAGVVQNDVAAAKPDRVSIAQAPGWNLIHDGKTNISLYGKVDVTLASINNEDAAGNRRTGSVVSWMSGNRWGIHGSRLIDKDSGTYVITTLESEFESPTGNMDTPNVLFNRDAWLGIESQTIGKLTIGRQNTLARDFIETWGDAFGTAKVDTSEAGWCNNAHMQQMIFYGGGSDGVRNDGSIVWKRVVGPWVGGASYAFGFVENGNGPATSAGQLANGSSTAVALAFNGSAFNLNSTYTHYVVSNYTHNIVTFGGNYQFGSLVQWKAGLAHAAVAQPTVGNRTDNALSTSLVLTPKGKMRYVLGFIDMDLENAGYNASGNTLLVTGDTSKVTSAADGARKTYYGAAFYKFDYQFDVYFAVDQVRLSGGYKLGSANGHNSQTEEGVGMRWSF
ncbi:MAG: porin [Pseudomonadota bacterium]|nr:porin [Pseudomonadota bacterium]